MTCENAEVLYPLDESGAIEMSPDRLTNTPAKRTRLFVAVRKPMLYQMHRAYPAIVTLLNTAFH